MSSQKHDNGESKGENGGNNVNICFCIARRRILGRDIIDFLRYPIIDTVKEEKSHTPPQYRKDNAFPNEDASSN